MHTQWKKSPDENGIQRVLVHEPKRVSLGMRIGYGFLRDPFGSPPIEID